MIKILIKDLFFAIYSLQACAKLILVYLGQLFYQIYPYFHTIKIVEYLIKFNIVLIICYKNKNIECPG